MKQVRHELSFFSRALTLGTVGTVLLAGCTSNAEHDSHGTQSAETTVAAPPVRCSGHLGRISVVDASAKIFRVEAVVGSPECAVAPDRVDVIELGALNTARERVATTSTMQIGEDFTAICDLGKPNAFLIESSGIEGSTRIYNSEVSKVLADAGVPLCTAEQAARA